MTAIEQTAFARLEAEERLLKPTHKGLTHHAGRFGFRGDIALTLTDSPVTLEQVFAAAENGGPSMSFVAGYLASFAGLGALATTLGETLSPDGKYLIYCQDLDLASRYMVELGDTVFYAFPIDDTSVYNELIDCFALDKTKMKKFDTAAKLDAIADAALKFDSTFEKVTFEDGLKRLGLAA